MLYPQCTVIVNINGLLRGTQGFDQNGSIDAEETFVQSLSYEDILWLTSTQQKISKST